VSASQAELLASLPEADRAAILAELSDAELAVLEYDWRFWARPEQIAPAGDWSTWLALAGRGFGKTEAGAQWIRERVRSGARNIALIAETQKDLEEVMVSRLLSIHPAGERPSVRYKPVRVVWPNGAMALGYNGSEPDQLRGPEFDTAWVDELAKYAYARETWDMLQFTMRSGSDPRVFVTTTPRPIPVIKEILADSRTVVTRGTTFDNAGNLPKQFLDRLRDQYEGTRLGRQELRAEILDDVPGALWTRGMIDAARVARTLPDMARVVVAVDPSGTNGTDAGDSIGIVAAGRGVDGRAYVLADRSCKLSPAGWGRRAVDAYHELSADRLVAERNFGGAMVAHVIRTTDPDVAYGEVVASRGKVIRAEPVAALYEQGRVTHIGDLTALEDQMCQMASDGYLGEGSPDRVDALVWALSELMLKDHGPGHALFEATRRDVQREAEKPKPEPVKPEFAVGSVEWMKQFSGN
jgi:phage terminase large subunit-like protein